MRRPATRGKNALLALIIAATFAVSFTLTSDGRFVLGLLANVLGAFAMYGVMIHPGEQAGTRSAGESPRQRDEFGDA